MKQLKYFISGLLFMAVIPELAEKLLELISVWIDALKVKPNMKVLNGKKDEQLIREFLKPADPVCEDGYDYDDSEDE